uniref:transient receptor potential channel pyrexia-like isoform X2 n=1 Tax=Styela clava TaxID=7725 RepID=UPI00193A90BF|nr:transient receptor potential channel pyrexia-like isoform X2 [Styela clava]
MAKRVHPGQENDAFEHEEAFGEMDVKKEKKNGNKVKHTTFQDVVNLELQAKAAGKEWHHFITRKRKFFRKADSDVGSMRTYSRLAAFQERELGLDIESDEDDGQLPASAPNGAISSTSKQVDRSKIRSLNKKVIGHFVSLNQLPHESAEVNLELLSSLFAQGAEANCCDRYGQTLLHEVARLWHVDVAEFLIAKGADINRSDRYGRTPIHVAAATDYPEMIEFFEKSGANIEARTAEELQTPLHFAARNDAVDACKILVKLGAKVETYDYRRRTPLHTAAELDRSETARWLVENGANVGVTDDSGLSCMTHMITKMGPVARDALDTFHKMDRTNRRQYFHLNLLEHDITDDKRITRSKEQGIHGSLAKTPLQVIVSYKQLDIIMHPVILKMLELKWSKFGRMGAIKLTCLNLLYISLWTALAVGVPWQTRYLYILPGLDVWRIVIWIFAFGMTLYYIGIEINEIITSRRRFHKWKEWRVNHINKDMRYTHPKWPEERNYLEREIDTLDDMLPSYFQDFWNFFDWTVYFLNFAVLVTHVLNIIVYNANNRPPPCCGESGCDITAEQIQNGSLTDKGSCALPNAYVNNACLSVWVNRIFVLNIIMMWLRLMKNMRSFRTLGPFVVMLGKIFYDILRFLFLYFEFYIPYACAFWMIFGDEPSIQSMSTVDQMLFSLYRITLVDEYEYDQMHAYDVVMTYILCGTFLGISAILCINLFIALLSDTFQRVYDNANANAVMQQAIQILSIEENLSHGQKERFRSFIQKKCSPLEEYYDDDLTTSQEDNLKKVTFQIKDQMEEVIEHLRLDEKERQDLENHLHADILSSTDHVIQNLRPRSRMDERNSSRFSQYQDYDNKKGMMGRTGIARLSSDITNIVSTVNNMQEGNVETLNKMQKDLKEIKSILRHLISSESQQRKPRKKDSESHQKSGSLPPASIIDPPVFPLEIRTLPPIQDLRQKRSQEFEPIRHPSLDRVTAEDVRRSVEDNLLRRLIHSSQDSRANRNARQDDLDFEMTLLPGSPARSTPRPDLSTSSRTPPPNRTVAFQDPEQSDLNIGDRGSSNV